MITSRPLFVIIILFLTGMVLAHVLFPARQAQYLPSSLKTDSEGVIVSPIQPHATSVRFLFKTKSFGHVVVTLPHRHQPIPVAYGDHVKLSLFMTSIAPPTNPLVSDYRQAMSYKNIYYYGTAQLPPQFIARDQGNVFVKMTLWFKSRFIHVNDLLFPDPYSVLLNSLLVGNTAVQFPPEIQWVYQRAGVIHLLVVSGSQVALLIAMASAGCQLLRLSGWSLFAIVSLLNFLFVLLTGADPSIVRAGLMAEIALLGKTMGRQTDVYTTMAVAALLSVFLNPYALFQIGFQLSFVATWALIYISPVMDVRLQRWIPQGLSSVFAVAFSTFLATTPLTVYYFSGISWVSIPLNILVSGISSLLVPIGFINTLLGMIWLPLSFSLSFILQGLMGLLHNMVMIAGQWSMAYGNVIAPPWFGVVLFYIWLIAFTERLRTSS